MLYVTHSAQRPATTAQRSIGGLIDRRLWLNSTGVIKGLDALKATSPKRRDITIRTSLSFRPETTLRLFCFVLFVD